MSRIHEALLKAQKEHELPYNILGPLPQSVGEPVHSLDEGTQAFISSTSVDVAAAAHQTEVPQTFLAHNWQPQTDKLVFMSHEATCGIEEFRKLSSRLLRERAQRYLKTVLISGATADEGKTFVTANLAMAMSRHPDNRVLVVDADLRRSSVHTVFGIEPLPGLSEYLSGSIGESVLVRQTPEPQLCIAPSGGFSTIPTELLYSPRMRQFVTHMSKCFDWIFIDSPPASAVSDSAVLSEVSDAVVMVITPGTSVDVIRKARKELGSKVLGIVLNRVDGVTSSYSYYSYQEHPGIVKSKSKGAVSRSRR